MSGENGVVKTPQNARGRANSRATEGTDSVTQADLSEFNNAEASTISQELSKLLSVEDVGPVGGQHDDEMFAMDLDEGKGGFGLPDSVNTMALPSPIPKKGEGEALAPTTVVGKPGPFRRLSRSSVDRSSFHLAAEPIGPRNFELLCVLGRGAFGKVVQAKHRGTGQIYALKITGKEFLHNKSAIDCTIEERDALTQVVHPFLVKLLATFQTKSKVYLVMEYLIGGELFSRLENRAFFVESEARFYAAEVVLAIEYLHSLGIIHRDLKPENVLLDAQGHIRITDFGLAKTTKKAGGGAKEGEAPCKTICGTDEYMAPEMIKGARYGKSVDWWAFGCLVFEMSTGNAPFRDKSRKKLHEKILHRKPVFPTYLSGNTVSFLKMLLQRNPEQRLGSQKSTMFEVKGVTALKNHRFFDGTDWHKVYTKQRDAPHVPTVQGELDTSNFDESFTQSSVIDSPRSSFTIKGKDGRSESPSKLFRGFSWQDPLFIEMHSKRERGNSMNSDGDEAINDHNLPGEDDVVLVMDRQGGKPRPGTGKKKKKKAADTMALKICSACHKELAGSMFTKSQHKRGTRRICMACVAAGKTSRPFPEETPIQQAAPEEAKEVAEEEEKKDCQDGGQPSTGAPATSPIVRQSSNGRRTLAAMAEANAAAAREKQATPVSPLSADVPAWKPPRLRADVPAWKPRFKANAPAWTPSTTQVHPKPAPSSAACPAWGKKPMAASLTPMVRRTQETERAKSPQESTSSPPARPAWGKDPAKPAPTEPSSASRPAWGRPHPKPAPSSAARPAWGKKPIAASPTPMVRRTQETERAKSPKESTSSTPARPAWGKDPAKPAPEPVAFAVNDFPTLGGKSKQTPKPEVNSVWGKKKWA